MVNELSATKTVEDLWFLMEEIPRSTPLMFFYPMRGAINQKQFGMSYNLGKSIVLCHEGCSDLIFPRMRFSLMGQRILDKILEDIDWAEKHNKKIIDYSEDYMKIAKEIREINVQNFSDKELAKVYERLSTVQSNCHQTGVLWVVLEFDHQLFTKYLLAYIEQKIKKNSLSLRANEVFSTLTTPTKESFAQLEEKSLLEIGVKIQENEKAWNFFLQSAPKEIEENLSQNFPEINSLLEKHVYEFQWLPFMYIGPAWSKKYFIETLHGIVRQNPDIKTLITRIEKNKKNLIERQKELFKHIGVHGKHEKLLRIAQDMVYTKALRKDALYFGMFVVDKILRELCKRKNLSLKQSQWLYPYEIVDILLGKIESNPSELNARHKYHVLYLHHENVKMLVGKEAKEFMAGIKMESTNIDSFKEKNLLGDCACPGIVRGVVKIIESPADMVKMNEGNILVAHATNPDVVPAMKKAGAIVTDLGGITCHAAIVSRELGKPCVIGTKHATKVLKDGMTVEVDATHAIVRILDREGE